MEAKALAPEPISSYSVLLSPCLPSLFAAHLRQIHPFVCQAMCFESFSACYWFSSPSSFSLFYIFFSIKHWFEFSTSTFSLLSLSRSLIISSASSIYFSFVHIFSLYIILFSCSVHFQALFSFSFSEWKVLWLVVYSVKTLLSVCLHVCVLGKRHAFNFVAVFHMKKC